MPLPTWQSYSHDSQTVGGDPVIPKPSGTTEGDLLICMIYSTVSTNTITPPSDTVPWTEIISGAAGRKVYYKIAGSSEPSSYTFVVSGTNVNIGVMVRYSNVDQSNPFDGSGTTTAGFGTSIVIPAVSPSGNNRTLIQLLISQGATSFTPPGSATERHDAQTPSFFHRTASGDELINSGSSDTRTWTGAGASANYMGAMIALNPEPVTGDASLTETVSFSADGQVNSDGSADLPITVLIEADGVVESALEGNAELNLIVGFSADGVVGGGGLGSLSDIVRFRICNALGLTEPIFSTYDMDWLLREYWGRRASIVGDLSGYTLADIMEANFPTLHYLKDVF